MKFGAVRAAEITAPQSSAAFGASWATLTAMDKQDDIQWAAVAVRVLLERAVAALAQQLREVAGL